MQNINIERVVGMQEAEKRSNKGTIIIADEVDSMIIDKLQDPPKSCRAFVGFTATIPSSDEGRAI